MPYSRSNARAWSGPKGLLVAVALLVPAAATAGPVQAPADYPSKAVRVIVGFAPGGGADVVARNIARRLTETLGQPFVVDNRSGGGGRIALETAVRAAPDGYTIAMASGSIAATSNLYKDAIYRLPEDFSPLTQVTRQIYVVLVPAALPVKSTTGLVALAKTAPGSVRYASTGIGSVQHLAGVLLARQAKVELLHVPYKGGGQSIADLASGQVQMAFLNPLGARAQIQAGRVKAIAVTGTKRTDAFPGVPAIAETFPGYEVTNWYGFMGPGKMPPRMVRFLAGKIAAIVNEPELKKHFELEGSEVVTSTPEAFTAFIKAEVSKWGRLIREAGIQAY